MTPTASAASRSVAPQVTEGPFWEDERLNRSDIRGDRSGVPLSLTLTIVRSAGGCAIQPGTWVDIWHADPGGNYSDEPAGMGNDNTLAQT